MTKAALIVDKQGLARKLASRPKGFVIYELAQNAWDEPGVTQVEINATMLAKRPVCRIEVRDDAPEGFSELSSVYTLFKDSKKAGNPELRGRFELGEKLVAAVALRLEVITTKGQVIIEGNGRRSGRSKLERGSAVIADVRMTREEYAEICEQVSRLIAPASVRTTFNGQPLKARSAVCSFETTLQTVRADEEGNLRFTQRRTRVNVYDPCKDEVACIYEMGIPVVETGDRWHYDVQQRVPVNWERSNVSPSYLRTLRVEVMNAMAEALDEEDVKSTWVSQALEDDHADPTAVKQVIDTRFGADAVAMDPSDPEGTKMSFAEGRNVVGGGTFSRGAWDNIRKAGALPPAGQVTPSPRPYGDGPPERVKPRSEWTDDMWRIARFAEQLCAYLVGKPCEIYIVVEPKLSWSANFQRCNGFSEHRLCLNYGRLGKSWFAEPKRNERVLRLLLHELAHAAVGDHLSHEFHREVGRLGAKLANLCLDAPELFRESPEGTP